MSRSRTPASYRNMIPPGAREERAMEGGRTTVRFVVDGHVALIAALDASGFPEYALASDRDGRRDGLQREWHPDGRIRYEARYVDGLQHGLQRQWDARGRLVVRTRFVRGTGLDLYCGDPRPGLVSESREMVEGARHGFERWWSGGRLWMEGRFDRDVEHGISREWNAEGRLSRGSPRYFVRGAKVNRRAYLRACESDATLPRPSARDDRPSRPRPRGIR